MRSTILAVLTLGFALCTGGHAQSTATSGVTYIPAARVDAGFAKGAVLADHGTYQVHASRRDTPGEVEVHAKDTDIIYVLEGTATFVTGGTVENGRDTAPGEIRAAAVTGGERRTLAKGDVIIVPRGTPHWFQEVPGPVLYYVVKVR